MNISGSPGALLKSWPYVKRKAAAFGHIVGEQKLSWGALTLLSLMSYAMIRDLPLLRRCGLSAWLLSGIEKLFVLTLKHFLNCISSKVVSCSMRASMLGSSQLLLDCGTTGSQ